MVSSCNKLHLNRPILGQICHMKSGTWHSICNIRKLNKIVEDIVRSVLWVAIGDGRKKSTLGRPLD